MAIEAAGSERILPWRHWWGLAAYAAFMGLVFTFAPYSNDVVFPLLFGGVAVFLITQLHGHGLGTRGKLAIALPLLAAMVVFHGLYSDQLVVGVTRLPMILYAGTLATAVLVWILSSIGRWLVRAAATPRAPGAAH
jgi:hypothetical protein